MARCAVCLAVALFLGMLPSSAGKAADALDASVSRLLAQAAANDTDTEAALAKMIQTNKDAMPALKTQLIAFKDQGRFSDSGKIAVALALLQAQNARNEALREMVRDTKKSLDHGLYAHSDGLLRDIVQEKCKALTATKIAHMKIELKVEIDAVTEDAAKAKEIMKQIKAMEDACDSYAKSFDVINDAESGNTSNQP